MKVIKIVILGDEQVGKTSLLHRLIYDTFKTSYKATLGVDVLKKTIEDLDVELSLWDFSGQKIFEKLRAAYYADCGGAALVFDVTHKESFESIKTWQDEAIKNSGHPTLTFMLLANKCDLASSQAVSDETMEAFAQSNNIKLIKISAKTGENVEMAFREFAKVMLSRYG
ncbi:MAG: Rab family GTPase [Promethearchaeota archaeon]